VDEYEFYVKNVDQKQNERKEQGLQISMPKKNFEDVEWQKEEWNVFRDESDEQAKIVDEPVKQHPCIWVSYKNGEVSLEDFLAWRDRKIDQNRLSPRYRGKCNRTSNFTKSTKRR